MITGKQGGASRGHQACTAWQQRLTHGRHILQLATQTAMHMHYSDLLAKHVMTLHALQHHQKSQNGSWPKTMETLTGLHNVMVPLQVWPATAAGLLNCIAGLSKAVYDFNRACLAPAVDLCTCSKQALVMPAICLSA